MGAEAVVTDADAADAAEVPTAFVAVTVNVYAVPGVSPVTVMVPEPEPEPPLGLEVAVYCVIGEPPSLPGAVNLTLAVVDPVAMTAPIPGMPGTPSALTCDEAADAAEVPAVFVAVALNVYSLPPVSPVTSHDPDAPVTVQLPAAAEASV
jgi:hypothetical protein